MTDYQSLAQQLAKLEERLSIHLQEGAVRHALIQNLSQNVSRLDHTVYGNGKEGLVTIMARTDERLESVIECLDGLPEAMQARIDHAIEKGLRRAEEPRPEKELSSADKFARWFSDRILPYFATGILIILLQAVWELAKIKLNTP